MSPPLDDSERLFAALRELPPRTARLLELRFVDLKSDAQLTAFYGMSAEAYRVHLLRAAQSFSEAFAGTRIAGTGTGAGTTTGAGPEARAATGARTGGADDYAQELSDAEAFFRALTTPEAVSGGALSPKLASALSAVRRLQDHAQAMRRKLDQWAAVEAASPAAQRETWLRRGLVVVLLVVTAVLYFTRNR